MDSFSFVEEVSSFDFAHYMTSFDITSLFTNISLKVTIDICVDKHLNIKTKVNNLTKELFRYLLEFIFFSFLMENSSSVCSYDSLAMGFPLRRSLANTFLCHFKEQSMSDFPINYKHISYRRYVEDTFLLFSPKFRVIKL